MGSGDIHELSAAALRRAYAGGELSPLEVVEHLLARIAALEPSLHAFITLTGDAALEQAQAATQRWAQLWAAGETDAAPLLLGVPVTVKDLVDLHGVPTTMGSLVTDRPPAAQDELPVARLREAGAIFLGKTNTSEFGLAAQTLNRLGPPTANPHDPSRTAGGSSGGAAAACAAGYGPLHHGTDGGGSVRLPAAYCGVVGLKPTTRRIPRRHRGAGMAQISSDGPLTRSVEDAALMLQAMAGPHPDDPGCLPDAPPDFLAAAAPGSLNGLRVSVATNLGNETPCQPAVAAALERAAAALCDAGAAVTDESPDIVDPLEVFPTFSAVGAAANYGELCAGREDELSDYTGGSLRRGGRLSGVEVARTEALRDRLAHEMARFFERYDALLTPTSAIVAHEHGARIDEIAGRPINPWTISIRYTPLANLIGAPAIALPGAPDTDGLPTSVQVICRPRDELTVLRIAAAYEDAIGAPAVAHLNNPNGEDD